MTDEADHFLLFGTHEREAQPVPLSAGKLTADLVGGNLRTISYDGVEVLRAISYLVRDRDWGTYSPNIAGLVVDQDPQRFSVEYTAHCQGPNETDLAIRVRISGTAEGRLVFEAEALSTSGFETNRCGFCLLHPIVGVAGEAVEVEHVDGVSQKTQMPDLIEPWQPFKDMRAITHTVTAGVQAECRMEGDTFEMEDQRNWSDASYKTYVRPLALPWPYRLPAGSPIEQRIVLTIADQRPGGSTAIRQSQQDAPIAIQPGSRSGSMPSIGVIITPAEAGSTLDETARLSAINPQELLFHFDPSAGHGRQAFVDFAAIAKRHPRSTTLEIALPCRQAPAIEAQEIASHMRAASFQPDAIVISPSVDRQSTPPGSAWPDCPPLEEVYAAARAAFPDSRLGGGMLSYFTELNRKRVPSGSLDFISHCTNPIVHAADDLSVMQTLEALPFITRSVRAIFGDKPYRIGPSTIPMRQNPYGSRTMENPLGGRIPMANRDPRHNGLYGKAFAFAYAAKTLDAGLECLTLSALTGPFGLIADADEPVAKGKNRPLFDAVRTLALLAGTPWQECISADPAKILAFAARPETGLALWLINITGGTQQVDLQAFGRLDGTTKPLTLAPYAVIVVDLAD